MALGLATSGVRGHAAAAVAALFLPLALLGLRDVVRLVHHARELELEAVEAERAGAKAAASLEAARATHATAVARAVGALEVHRTRDLVAATAMLVEELERDGFTSIASPPVRDWPRRAPRARAARGLHAVERSSSTVSVEAPLERVPAVVDAALRSSAGVSSVSVTKSATGAAQVGLRLSAVTVDRPALEQSLRALAAASSRVAAQPPTADLSPRTLLPQAVARAILGPGHRDRARKAALERTREADARRLTDVLRDQARDLASTATVLADARPAREPSTVAGGGRCWLDLLASGHVEALTWDGSSIVTLVRAPGREAAVACVGRQSSQTNTLASGAFELTWRLPSPQAKPASSPAASP